MTATQSLFDFSSLGTTAVTGGDIAGLLQGRWMELARKLGWSFLGTWALYSVGGDEMIFNQLANLGLPENLVAPASTTLLSTAGDIVGQAGRQLTGM